MKVKDKIKNKLKKKFKRLEVDGDIVFEVNENNVKEEWTRQAALYQEYGIKTINAVKKKNKLNLSFDIAVAEFDKKIRDKPLKYFSHGVKPTETGIKNIIITNGEIENIQNELIDAEYQVSLYSNVLKALEHRKKALEFFGQIFLSSLYSEPREENISDVKVRKFINRKKMGGGG